MAQLRIVLTLHCTGPHADAHAVQELDRLRRSNLQARRLSGVLSRPLVTRCWYVDSAVSIPLIVLPVGYGLINATAFGSYSWGKTFARTNETWNGRKGELSFIIVLRQCAHRFAFILAQFLMTTSGICPCSSCLLRVALPAWSRYAGSRIYVSIYLLSALAFSVLRARSHRANQNRHASAVKCTLQQPMPLTCSRTQEQGRFHNAAALSRQHPLSDRRHQD